MEQVPRGSRCDKGRGLVAGEDGGGGCAAKGVDGGSLWFQESLPLYMVITSSVLFFCLL
jgi:hypothetical protein